MAITLDQQNLHNDLVDVWNKYNEVEGLTNELAVIGMLLGAILGSRTEILKNKVCEYGEARLEELDSRSLVIKQHFS